MKAKIINKNPYAPQLEEGEIITIVPGMETDAEGIWNAPAGKLFLCRKEDGTFAYTTPRDLQILPDASDDVDWAAFRRETAKGILCAMVAKNGGDVHMERCLSLADKLIEKLKEY